MVRSELVFDRVPNPAPKKTLSGAFMREVDAAILGWADPVGRQWSNRRTACWVIRICGASGAVNMLCRELGQLGGRHPIMISWATATPCPVTPEPQKAQVSTGIAGT